MGRLTVPESGMIGVNRFNQFAWGVGRVERSDTVVASGVYLCGEAVNRSAR